VTLTTSDSKLGSPCEAFSHLAQMHKDFPLSKALHYTQVPGVDECRHLWKRQDSLNITSKPGTHTYPGSPEVEAEMD